MLVVMKFGGTSVGNTAALQQVIRICKKARSQGNEIVVVVSAMSGITDLLLNSARKAETGDAEGVTRAHQELLKRHTAAIDEPSPAADPVFRIPMHTSIVLCLSYTAGPFHFIANSS